MYDVPLGYLPMQCTSSVCQENIVWLREFYQYFTVCGLIGQSVAILPRLDLRRSVARVCTISSENVSMLYGSSAVYASAKARLLDYSISENE